MRSTALKQGEAILDSLWVIFLFCFVSNTQGTLFLSAWEFYNCFNHHKGGYILLRKCDGIKEVAVYFQRQSLASI